MKSAKQEVIELLDALPDDVPMDRLVERLLFKAGLLRASEEIDKGEGIPHEKVMEELDQWLDSLGHPRLAETSGE